MGTHKKNPYAENELFLDDCHVLSACRGGCPKHRFARTVYGEPGLHYSCQGYQKFFLHIRRYLRVMTQLLEHGYPASMVMDAVKGPLLLNVNYPLPEKESF